MKLSLQWLKQYVAVRWTPQQLAERLTLAGLEITDRRVVGDDVLLECEVTPNRPDWLSHIGVARELAALSGAPLRLPAVPPMTAAPGRRPVITVKDHKACRRYVGTLIEGVAVGPSPAWLRQRVESVGLRSINNVVDVTNFVLFELGQPLHAFDADRLAKGRIAVRRGVAGETLTTIDGVTRRLDPTILVIADADRPIALAGLMGGQATEVTAATRRVLLESAWFDPLVTRRCSRTLGLASDSSYRFERGVDVEQAATAARRAAALIVEVAGGRVVGGPVDRRAARAKSRPIAWDPAMAAALGAPIPSSKQRTVFERLACRVDGHGARWRVTPPSFRADLKQPADLLEELARLWGYDRLPVTLPRSYPSLRAAAPDAAETLRLRESRLRDTLVAAGLDETMTYSLISPAHLQQFLWTAPVLPLRNPLSQDHSVLRPTLLVGALETVARNLNRRAAGVSVFELGRTYHGAETGRPEERRRLAIALAGLRPSSWDAKPTPWTLFHAKGILDEAGRRLGAGPLAWEPAAHAADLRPWCRPGTDLIAAPASAAVPNAVLGVVSVAVAGRFDIPETVEVIVGEVDWPSWLGAAAPPQPFQPLPKVAPVTRDIALLVDESVGHAQVLQVIRNVGGPLVTRATLFDQYRGAQVPTGRKGLAYTITYSAGDRTLTDEEVAALHTAIRDALHTRLQATLR
ncbi:MAG: phenylalanine--tRNA ligase subunit beta [Omnitrophica WOR_2 bacterium RIFCSPHIGHO2_02_FULL_68_15]|nr:MAG: phenylalanine--tRNA ligase subunit beta [Omnitrophica WOR_2 bacterium RIFCSPHIGHO2_02_FULL_68_15]